MSENLKFVKALYETIVEGNRELDEDLYETTKIEPNTDPYWKSAISLYKSLSKEQRDVLMLIIKQTRVDAISEMLGVIDGSSTLSGCSLEPKLLLDSVDTERELQDLFLEFVEEENSGN